MLSFDDIIESLQEIAQVAYAVGEDALKENLEVEIANLGPLQSDLAQALHLLDGYVPLAPCWQHRDEPAEDCSINRAQALLARHGIREDRVPPTVKAWWVQSTDS